MITPCRRTPAGFAAVGLTRSGVRRSSSVCIRTSAQVLTEDALLTTSTLEKRFSRSEAQAGSQLGKDRGPDA